MNTPLQPGLPRNCDAEIPELLRPWVEVWSERGLPRTLLIELGIHLLASGSATISKAEEDQVLSILKRWARLEREDPEFSVEKALAAMAPATPLTVEAYEMLGQGQRDQVSKLKREHPLLRLVESKHQTRVAGFRAAVEAYIGHKSDPRRKSTDTSNESDWGVLLSTMDPLIGKRLKDFCSGSRKRTGLLVRAIVGIEGRQRGLLDVLKISFTDGSPERIRSVHNQSRLTASGGEIPKTAGMTKAADIAAGLQRSITLKAERAKSAEETGRRAYAEEKAKARSQKARKRG